MIPWLNNGDDFPPCETAQQNPNGLLCAGGDLSPARLLAAYRRGIFPWFSPGEPILWWSPDPRMTLDPVTFRPSRSLRQRLRRGGYEVRLDHNFAAVIRACAETPRKGQRGTWISNQIQNAYQQLHALGYAHSAETWVDGQLSGGLYGVAIGGIFYGESMFAHLPDASKIALAHLIHYLRQCGYGLIDCQMATPHLASLGAREISRNDFLIRVRQLNALDIPAGHWPQDGARRHEEP